MSGWTFLKPGWSTSSSLAKQDRRTFSEYQIQTLSDIYHVVQSRLDSYRQSAAAIFIGVIAAILAFDSGFIHVMMDFPVLHPVSYHPIFVIDGCGLVLLAIAFGGWYTIRLIGRFFSEMTGIVSRIDRVNRVWEPGVWIHGEALFPSSFAQSIKVGISLQDQDLEGWSDPAIRLFATFTLYLALVHGLAYGGLALAAYRGFAAIPPPAAQVTTRMPPAIPVTPSAGTTSIPKSKTHGGG